MPQHISAFALVVPDYDQALDFYVTILGFDLVEDTHLSDTKRWVLVAPKNAQTRILLAQANGEEQSAAIGYQTGGRVGFFLHTDTFETDYTRMKTAGVFFEELPRQEPYGTVAVFNDPFGNRWDLLQLTR